VGVLVDCFGEKVMLKMPWRGWLVIAKKIGYLQSQLILARIYFIAIALFVLEIHFLQVEG
jgi:hypothetical protein